MSDNSNPYKAPETTAATTVAEGDLYLPDPVRVPLLKSVPWIRFMGILGFIGAGIVALVGILFIVGITSIMGAFDMAGMGSGMAVFVGLLYIGFAVLIFFPALYLYRSGTSLKAFRDSSTSGDLASSFTSSFRFWKFIGILYIIYFSILALTLTITAIVGVASLF